LSTRLAPGPAAGHSTGHSTVRWAGAGGPAVDVQGLTKLYDERRVLDAVDLVVEAGSVLALLGHNGAGKTTLVRVLSTLERPDEGSARVNGHDVVTAAARVRRQIALAGQYAAVDELLTGRGNLTMLGRLMGLGRREARDRAQQLLGELDLEDAADRKVETYSGGMRRRLDLAACIVTRPAVLFLDEPTTGVDPLTRADLWSAVASLAAHGVAVLVTTQYLEEAEQIADAVVVLDHGRVIAQGSPSQVTASAGSERIVVTLTDPGDLTLVARLLHPLALSEPAVDERRCTITFGAADPLRALGPCADVLSAAGVPLRGVALRAPSLEEAFIHLTGGGRNGRNAAAPAPSTSAAESDPDAAR
jgi:ABC-2 type transport system ATP-binding protein